MFRTARLGSTQRLRLSAVVGATLLVLTLGAIEALVLPHFFSPTTAIALQILIAIGGVIAFTWGMFTLIGNVQDQLRRQNEELSSLHLAGLAVNHDLKVDIVLQRVVDEARRLTGARYSALMTEGHSIEAPLFLVSGLSNEEQDRIGEPPRGRGVLGLAYREKRSIRLEEISAHAASIGFPPNHPPMRTLLTVPIRAGDDVFGQLYLSDKANERPFDAGDQEVVERFATLAALAIKNAQQLGKIEALAIATERNRVAREMHDNTAQILSYVNMKTQAAAVLVESGEFNRAIIYLDEIRRAVQEAVNDLREQIAGLRAADADASIEDLIVQYLQRWSERSGISPSVHFPEERMKLPPESRLQVLRIVQEALTNVEKHAGACHASVSATYEGDDLVFDIGDDGTGFKTGDSGPGIEPRFGIAIMRERARALRGEIEFDCSHCGGVRVRLRMPIDQTSKRSITP